MTHAEMLRRLRADVAAIALVEDVSPVLADVAPAIVEARTRLAALPAADLVERLVALLDNDGHTWGCLGRRGRPCSTRCELTGYVLDRCAAALEVSDGN